MRLVSEEPEKLLERVLVGVSSAGQPECLSRQFCTACCTGLLLSKLTPAFHAGKAASSQASVSEHCWCSSENPFPSKERSQSTNRGYPQGACEHSVPSWCSPLMCLARLRDGCSPPFTPPSIPLTFQDKSSALGDGLELCQHGRVPALAPAVPWDKVVLISNMEGVKPCFSTGDELQ